MNWFLYDRDFCREKVKQCNKVTNSGDTVVEFSSQKSSELQNDRLYQEITVYWKGNRTLCKI